MSLSEDMFALAKTHDWQACHRRIDEEGPGDDQQSRFSLAYWRSLVLQGEGKYEDALRVLDHSRGDFFTQCGYRLFRGRIFYHMGKSAQAIEALRDAPFGEEIDTFPGITCEAIFLYCYLLKKSGREPPPNLIAALPDDFGTRFYERRRLTKADLLPAGAAPSPT
jgi:hypothetical protein